MLSKRLLVGSRLRFDGETHTVAAFEGGAVRLRSQRGEAMLVAVGELVTAPSFGLLAAGENTEEAGQAPRVTTPLDGIPDEARQQAEVLLAHLTEAETGYQSGSDNHPLVGEPKPEYDPVGSTLEQRLHAKAEELGVHFGSLKRYRSNYRKHGLIALVDKRAARIAPERLDPRVKEAILAELAEQTYRTNVSKSRIRRLVERRLDATHGVGAVPLPSESTFLRHLNRLGRNHNSFGSARSRRNASNRSATPYRRIQATRPGELVLIDSTPLDVFALDPVSFEWLRLELTIALDLYTRSIVAALLTPTTRAVDAALLLRDIIGPKPLPSGSTGGWCYGGIPEEIVIALDPGFGDQRAAGIPPVLPETVVVDHGKIYVSQTFKDACACLGVTVQFARPKTPTDKAHVERVFRTIRESLLENLPGYKGPDVHSRGDQVEQEAFYFIDELNEILLSWVAEVYQRRQHGGLHLPGQPEIIVSPNEMYEEGLTRAGFVQIAPNPNLYYELLPTEFRHIHHYGVELRGLRYDGEAIENYRGERSPYGGVHSGKWPFRYDPRDRSKIFFCDPATGDWQELRWIGASEMPRPFDELTLDFAKTLLRRRNGNGRNEEETAAALNGLLDRLERQRPQRTRAERRTFGREVIQRNRVEHARNGVTPAVPASSPTADVDDAQAAEEVEAMELVDEAALTSGGTEHTSDRPAPLSAAPDDDTVIDEFEEEEIDALPLVGDDEDESLFEGWS
jgi:transposase InsO family protein